MGPGILSGALAAFRGRPDETAVTDDSRAQSWAEFEAELRDIAGDLEDEADRGPVFVRGPSNASFLASFLAAPMAGRPGCTLHSDWAAPELEAAVEDAGGFEPRPADETDPVFYVGFTSGTSGRPKPFARRWESWSSSFGPAGELFSVHSGDRVFLPGSLQHSHFLFGAVFALNRGAGVRLFERFDAETLAEELARVRRGVLYLVPTMLLALDELRPAPMTGVHSLVVSGAKMEAHHWEIARRVFPRATVGELYGASELSFVTVNTEGERPSDPGYVGRPFPGVEIEIRRPTDAAPDEPGPVYVRSPYLFDGYLEGNRSVSPAGEDGFMTVGDVGLLTEEGLTLVGRASNMLITGGKNVHPEEVEGRLSDHPGVAECVVGGAPHPRWGEQLVGFVVAADGGAPDADSLRGHLRGRVAPYKIPKRWFLVDSIPRTAANKTDRDLDRLFEAATEL